MEALRWSRAETQSCIWGEYNSTFTHLNDLTALERQCPWPSWQIPISWVCATVEMKKRAGSLRSPGAVWLSPENKSLLPVTKSRRRATEGAPGPSCPSSFYIQDSEELISPGFLHFQPYCKVTIGPFHSKTLFTWVLFQKLSSFPGCQMRILQTHIFHCTMHIKYFCRHVPHHYMWKKLESV